MKLMKTVTTAVAVSVTASAALAHATLKVQEAPQGAYFVTTVKVPHGCEGEATKKLTITIPEGVIAVKPMPKAGWDLEIVTGSYQNTYDNHGTDVSSGVVKLIWTGELLDAHYDEFTFSTKLTESLKAGTTVFFDPHQQCDTGVVHWKEIPAEGQDPHELERPAPGLKITKGHAHH